MRNRHCPGALILVLTAILVCTPALAAIHLPAELTVIEAEAFRASGAGSFVLPEGVQQIGSRAFAEVDVRQINLPSSLTAIADDAFDEEPGTIFADPGSYAWDWCVSKGWQPLKGRKVSLGENQTTLNAGEHLTFAFTAPYTAKFCFFSTGDLNTSAILYNAKHIQLVRNDDIDRENRNFLISRRLTSGETVFLEVYLHDASTSGSFPVCIRPMTERAWIGGNQATLAAGEHRTYAFTAPYTAEYRFCSTGDLDTSAILYDADYNPISHSSSGGDGDNFLILQTLSADTTVYLELHLSDAAQSGSFSLRIERVDQIELSTGSRRALIIGNVYENSPSINTLWGCDGDRKLMSNLLQKSVAKYPYSVTEKRNLTASQILSAIPEAFSGADNDSVSLFYFSGHGALGSGQLVGTDKKGVSFSQLKRALDKVPGKKIVILQSCLSGQAIGKSSEAEAPSDVELNAFNRRIIETFASPSSKSGELAASNYYVLTSAGKDQLSWSTDSYGLFTCDLAHGSGWNGYNDSVLSTLPADLSGDGNITLDEAYLSTLSNWDIGYSSDPQVYPTDSGFVLWGR